jgi:hypothetical protein
MPCCPISTGLDTSSARIFFYLLGREKPLASLELFSIGTMAVEVLDDNYVALIAILTVGVQLVGYFIAYCLQVDKVRNSCRCSVQLRG